MTKLEILRSVFSDHEINEMVEEAIRMYEDGYGCLRPYEDPKDKAMREEQEERIERENSLYERMNGNDYL